MTQLPADTADYPTTCSMFDIIVKSLRRTHDSSSDQLDQNLFFISFFFFFFFFITDKAVGHVCPMFIAHSLLNLS